MKKLIPVPILVGGPSGVGKSSIIENIVSNYKSFIRPVSFTTREKRPLENEDEYNFITDEEYLKLKSESEFINDDEVYGYHYASSKHSIDNLIEEGKFPIKEIHPRNFEKFKNIYPTLVTVLLLPANFSLLPQNNLERSKDDLNFYSSVNKDEFDIILYNDFTVPIPELSQYLYNTIISLLTYDDIFPRPSIIDNLNSRGYNKIAKEFSESKRLTTRNFHSISKPFFDYAFNKYLNHAQSILEIGPGQNWLLNNFNIPFAKYSAIDISDIMSELTESHIHTCSIRDTSYSFNTFDCVIASLADPYFFPTALSEVWRILKPNGYYILTTPSSKWSKGIRHAPDKTKFILEDNTVAEVYSFTFTLEVVKDIVQTCGFEIIFAEEKSAEMLILEGDKISPILVDASKANGTNLKELILLNNLILKKSK